jgi:hypothetical protein
MAIKYKASTYEYSSGKHIIKIEITKQTSKKVFWDSPSVWREGKIEHNQAFITSYRVSFFDTFQEAKDWLMAYANSLIANAESDWQRAKQYKQKINNLTEKDTQ